MSVSENNEDRIMDGNQSNVITPKDSTANVIEVIEPSSLNNEKLSTNFSSAFSKIKDSSLYEEAPENVKNLPEGKTATFKQSSQNCIIVSSRQRGNPILKHIRNAPWEYGEIVPDYVMGATTCAMFLSLRYHTLNPNYIHDRLQSLGQQYVLRVLLVQVDIKDPHHELKQLTKICVLADLTLMLAWNAEEAGRIIEIYKIYEHKPPDLIMERQDANPYSMMVDALTTIKSVNRTDAMTLLSTFGQLTKILDASIQELSYCPGIGIPKATKIYNVLHQKFSKD